MEMRLQQLSQLHCFVERVDKDLTMILQNLQWDRKRLLVDLPMGTCRYNNNHKMPLDKIQSHETKCFVKLQGYSEDDAFLPEPLDINANTLVKLSTQQIFVILNDASRCDPLFKRGNKWENRFLEPWTMERLQATYTADERRAIHDAVVQAVPSCHDLADLALLSGNNDEAATKAKSRVEILAELRDVKRRRPKYRMASKTRNYSDVLRDVIKTQMEFYSETSQSTGFTETAFRHQCGQKNNNSAKTTGSHGSETHKPNDNCRPFNHKKDRDRESYKHSNTIRKETFDYESRERQKLPSYRRNECRSSTRSERNTKERHTQSSYRRKRNEKSYTPDESEDARTLDNVSRYRAMNKRSRDAEEGQPRSYHRKNNSINTSGSERMNIKSERLETSERESRLRGNDTSPRYADSEPQVCIKTERINSPKLDMVKNEVSKTSTAISNTNRGSIAFIKTEKAVTPESQYSYSSTESDSSGNTENENRKSSAIKREKDVDVAKTKRNREKDSGYYNTSTDVDRRATNAGRRVVYLERSSERRRHNNSAENIFTKREIVAGTERNINDRTKTSDGNRSNNVKSYVKNVNRDGERSVQYDRHGHRSGQRHRRSSSSDSSTGAKHRRYSRRDEKYHGSSDTRKNYYDRGDPRRNYEKCNSYYDKEHAKPVVRGTEAQYHDERLIRKRYS